MPDEDLAEYLARRIFNASMLAEPGDVRRIAFKGVRQENGVERDFGGFNQHALRDFIRKALAERPTDSAGEQQ